MTIFDYEKIFSRRSLSKVLDTYKNIFIQTIGWRIGLKTITKDIKEKILCHDFVLPEGLKANCELRVPGLPALTTAVNIFMDGSDLYFNIPEVQIAADIGWYPVKEGAAGQLIPEENYGEVLAKEKGRTVYLNKCLIRERSWKQLPVKSISANKVSAHELSINYTQTTKPIIHFESYILSGFDLPFWPEVTDCSKHDGSFELSMDRITLPVENGDWTIRRINDKYVRAIFSFGSNVEFQNQQYILDILPLLSFLNGRRIYLVKKELFNQDAEIVTETYLRNLSPEIHPAQCFPIPLKPDDECQIIYQLPLLFNDLSLNYLDWKAKIFIDEGIFHLQSALVAALESKFSILSISLETFSSSYSRYKMGNQIEASKYLDNDEFNKDMKPIMLLFEQAFKNKLLPQDFESMKGKIRGINNRAMTNKFNIILSDLGITLTKAEEKILQKRNSAIHDGVLDRDRTKIDWQKIMGYEGVMLTIINRVILRLLKYQDKVVDYGQNGHPERAI